MNPERFSTTTNILLWQIGDAVITAALMCLIVALILGVYRSWARMGN